MQYHALPLFCNADLPINGQAMLPGKTEEASAPIHHKLDTKTQRGGTHDYPSTIVFSTNHIQELYLHAVCMHIIHHIYIYIYYILFIS